MGAGRRKGPWGWGQPVAAGWSGSRAHPLFLWPGRSLLLSAVQPLRSWTFQNGRAEGRSSWMGERVDQMAPPGSSLLGCFKILCSSFLFPKMGGNQGTIYMREKGQRLSHPRDNRGPPDCHRPAPLSPQSRGRGPSGKIAYF